MGRNRYDDEDDERPTQTRSGLSTMQIVLYCVLGVLLLGCMGLAASFFSFVNSKPTQATPKPPVVEVPKFKPFDKKAEVPPPPAQPKPVEPFPMKQVLKELKKAERSQNAILSDYMGKEYSLKVTVAIFTPESLAACVSDTGEKMYLSLPSSAKVNQTYTVKVKLRGYDQFQDLPWDFAVLPD